MAPGESKVASRNVARALGGIRSLGAHAQICAGNGIVNRFERQVGGEPERKTSRATGNSPRR